RLHISRSVERVHGNRRRLEFAVRISGPPAAARSRRADLGVTKIAHEYQLIFEIQSNSVRVLQLRIAAGNRPKRLLFPGCLLAIYDNRVLVLDRQKHFLFFFVDRYAESSVRSEERRVGKECRARWARYKGRKNGKTIMI